MHFAKRISCRIIETTRLTPTVVGLRLRPYSRVTFEPGQFVSLVIPACVPGKKPLKRCYSIANSPEDAQKNGVELCIKLVPGGAGSTYVESLKAGDTVHVFASYGHFKLRTAAQSNKSICFIATGTGIAPLRSMLMSPEVKALGYQNVTVLFGARSEEEILYQQEIEALGVKCVFAVSQPKANYQGFPGRVTDYLHALPASWNWHRTDFYVCGNGAMVDEVESILYKGRGVPMTNIYVERFSLQAKVFPFPVKPARVPRKVPVVFQA